MIDKLKQPVSLIIRMSLTCLDYTCMNTVDSYLFFFFLGGGCTNFHELSSFFFKVHAYGHATLLINLFSTSSMIKIRRGCLSGSRLWNGPKQIQENWFRSLAFHRISLSRLDSRDFDLTLQNEAVWGERDSGNYPQFYARCS